MGIPWELAGVAMSRSSFLSEMVTGVGASLSCFALASRLVVPGALVGELQGGREILVINIGWCRGSFACLHL